ncbi:MAG TPA: PD-(D/E)XK nuclease family protein [Pirellulales bacterium]|nr:PD-(D/E)XK nuclease family protein [Pirellulales bacterium]
MQFLETIEGRTGEELTSAVLKFLLVNSATMREHFVRRLQHQLPASKTPTFRDGIICQNEVAVTGDDGAGRIDLVIREEAGMVLGLENKFWANFTPNQPKKYWGDLVRLARNDEASCRLVILVPARRHDEIKDHLKAQGIEQKCCILFWDDLRHDFADVAQRERTEVAAAALFLDEYVQRQVLTIQIDIRRHQLLGPDIQLPNDFHYDFLYRLKTCLPNPEAIRPARSWIGVHFSVVPSTDVATYPKQWFGFLRPEGSASVVMGIHTGIKQFTVPVLAWARNGAGWSTAAFVEVDYDESVKTTLDWKDRLAEILRPLEEAVRGHPGGSG